MISPKNNIPVYENCVRCMGSDELFRHTDEPALANYPDICLCLDCIDDLVEEYNSTHPVTCVLCGNEIALGDPCHQINTGLHTDGFTQHGTLGLACGCFLRAAEAQASKTYEPSLVERECIARALDESAEQYLKEHPHDEI